jgi:EmrB/QacA subfamily drug resistance transporter
MLPKNIPEPTTTARVDTDPASNDLRWETTDAGSARLGGRACATLLALCGAVFLDALDVSMVGVALPSIRSDLHVSTSALQWVVSAYVLGYAGFQLFGGRAADLLGRRRMFLLSLGVFIVASGLGGLANDEALLIATRFIKGISAAFTMPAGMSIITTSFGEGPARNKALSAYAATGAAGFSLGLVFSGLLTEVGWRWVFFFPVPLGLLALAVASRLVPADTRAFDRRQSFDVLGAATMTVAMLLLVFTLVEAPNQGWGSARTLGSFAVATAILAAFIVRETRAPQPLVRLGILRSSALVRANLGGLSLFGAWVGFQFLTTLYLQQLRGWSPLETGLAIFPCGCLVAVLSPRIAPLIARFGVTTPIVVGLSLNVAGYALFLPVSLHSSYAGAMLPTFILTGLGFALALGPLNIAATNGVAPAEQGLAAGLFSTSFQFGGALVLAVVTAAFNATKGTGASPRAFLDGLHAGLLASIAAAVLGVAAMALRHRSRVAETIDVSTEAAAEPEAA